MPPSLPPAQLLEGAPLPGHCLGWGRPCRLHVVPEPRVASAALCWTHRHRQLQVGGSGSCMTSFLVVFKFLLHSGSDNKESACSVGDLCSIPGLARSPGEGNSNPLQYSCLESDTTEQLHVILKLPFFSPLAFMSLAALLQSVLFPPSYFPNTFLQFGHHILMVPLS